MLDIRGEPVSESALENAVTPEEARDIISLPSAWIVHVQELTDGRHVVTRHIVCEYCDLCEIQGDVRGSEEWVAVPFRNDIYFQHEDKWP